jgi:HSP20 family molecular chaperone IbpA
MSRGPLLSSPMLLGFEEIERLIDKLSKGGGDSYPPYNIERIVGSATARDAGEANRATTDALRITLAVAGFRREQIDILVEDNQLVIRGRQDDDGPREFIHRGIASRQFSRTFVLADGIEVLSADLTNGLLSIDLVKPEAARIVRRIEIGKRPPDNRVSQKTGSGVPQKSSSRVTQDTDV